MLPRKRKRQGEFSDCDDRDWKRLARGPAEEFERQLRMEMALSLSGASDEWRYKTARHDVLNALQYKLRVPFILHQFGSSATGLAFKGSDIDLCVEVMGSNPSPTLAEVQRALRWNPMFSEVIGIRARVPIVKFKHIPSGIRGDVSFSGTLAVRNTALLRLLCSIDPRVHPLMAFTKRWGRAQGVANTDEDRQRLSAYALALLTVFYLQSRGILPSVATLQAHCNHKIFEQGWECSFAELQWRSHDCASLLDLVVGFFAFYADFSFHADVVCPLLGRAVPRTNFLQISSLPREMAANANRVIVPPLPEPIPIAATDPAPTVGRKKKKKKKKESAQIIRRRCPGLELEHHAFCVQDPFVLDHNVARGQTDAAFKTFTQALASANQLCKQVPGFRLLPALLAPCEANTTQGKQVTKFDNSQPKALPPS